MEACIFAQRRTRERAEQCLWRMAQREMPCSKPCGEIDLSLPVKGVEQSGADYRRIGGQIVHPLAALAWDARRRHIEIASEIERHRSVQHATNAHHVTIFAVPIRTGI
jgi:hypothetical protein